jgi:hypothetical protein
MMVMVLILWWGGEHTVIALAGRDNPHQFSRVSSQINGSTPVREYLSVS